MEELLREVLINRVFLILLFVGGGTMFAFIGLMAFWSVGMVRREFSEWRATTILLAQVLRRLEERLDQEKLPPP